MDASFRSNLRDELNYQDLTVKELSMRTGIPQPTLNSYLSSREAIPPADAAVKIAKALNVTVEYLVTGSDEKVVPQDYEKFLPYRMILADLRTLDMESTHMLSVMIHALAEKFRR